MADEEAINFLNKLKLGHLVEAFKTAGATKQDFSYIRANFPELQNLIPLLVDRRTFVEGLDAEQASTSVPPPSATITSEAPISIRANLETICLSSDKGKIFWAQKDENFDKPEKELLADVITKYFYEAGNGSITKGMFLEMFNIIQLQFPAERLHTWYIPPNAELKTKPAGKLYSSYRTLQEHRRQEVGPQKGKRANKSVTLTKHEIRKEQANKTFSELTKEEINACESAKLRLNTIPLNLSSEIFACWDECFPIRRHEIMSECFTMKQYCVLYNFGRANDLILRDFSRVNEKFLDLPSKVPVFIKKFKGLFAGYRKYFKDYSDLSDEIVRTFNGNTKVNDHSVFLAFFALPLILRENWVGRNEKRFRPTIHMTREAFICLIPTEATLAEKRKKKLEDAISRKVTIQPYIVAVGTVACVLRYFVIFDELMIPCASCIEAIDVHYKMHDAFNLQYAAECRSVLIFIQNFFYELNYDGDVPVPNVESLISDLEK